MTPSELDEHERNLKRWLHLLSVDDSREHRSPAMASGGCFKAHGERGCPCCDAHDDLVGDMPEMIQAVGALVDEVRRLREALEHYADPDNWCEHDAEVYGHLCVFTPGTAEKSAKEALESDATGRGRE